MPVLVQIKIKWFCQDIDEKKYYLNRTLKCNAFALHQSWPTRCKISNTKIGVIVRKFVFKYIKAF